MIKKRPPSSGLQWISDGISLFFESWLRWLLIGAFYLSVVVLPQLLLPGLIGSLLANMIAFVGIGYAMIAAEQQAAGQQIQLGAVWRSFTDNGRIGRAFSVALIITGIFFVLMLGVGYYLVSQFGDNIGELEVIANQQKTDTEGAAQAMIALLKPHLADLLGVLLLLSVVLMPVYWLYYYALPLTVLQDRAVGESIKLAIEGGYKNIAAWLVFGLCYVLLALVMLFTVSLTFGAALFAFLPITFLIQYVSYKDIFSDTGVQMSVDFTKPESSEDEDSRYF
ncbi:MAG: BPSS1780 family membrane protein [Pseudomonadota bacterium]|nr:BPSS1780 family membrane protein [Pseudomonadota bacterium]